MANELIEYLIQHDHKVGSFEIEEEWNDIGNIEVLKRLNRI